MTSLVLTKRS